MILVYILMITSLVLLLYNYRTGIVIVMMVITNFGEFVYVNPNLEIGDFGGIGKIFFMDIFWISLTCVLLLKSKDLFLLRYKLSLNILLALCVISAIIPFLISSFTIKDAISVIRPLGNFLLLPYFVLLIKNKDAVNFFEKTILFLVFFFIIVQVYEYIMQKRVPIRLFEKESFFYGENPFSVEFGGIKTGYIWSRIGYLLPFNLFYGCYYYFTDRKNFGLLLIAVYLLAIMIALSRIWIIGFAFFLIVLSLFLLLKRERESYVKVKLFSLIGSFALIGFILLFTSSTFNQIFDIFLLRVNSISDLADKTDASFLGREYTLLQMISVWFEYPVFGAGFSTISRRLTTNDLGFPNFITIFGFSGIVMLLFFVKQYFDNIIIFFKDYYILFVCFATVMLMIIFMSIFSIDMFYFNATGAILFALANIFYNLAKQEKGTYI
ncbi:MAG: hypothetical protein HGGPFJEG_01248 [Ignavibacteria bacterium]|nr:hypothetical protein [Ignavibacteria bacterium]